VIGQWQDTRCIDNNLPKEGIHFGVLEKVRAWIVSMRDDAPSRGDKRAFAPAWRLNWRQHRPDLGKGDAGIISRSFGCSDSRALVEMDVDGC
jgi:hypothetical protein